ncbi:hypothetical protein SESBI_04964 [Sesbania bispinosa]|nr:hypothetical protein SESBI_04964 [Sesbania bispinosa]
MATVLNRFSAHIPRPCLHRFALPVDPHHLHVQPLRCEAPSRSSRRSPIDLRRGHDLKMVLVQKTDGAHFGRGWRWFRKIETKWRPRRSPWEEMRRALAIGARGGAVTAMVMGSFDGHSLLNVPPGLACFAPNVVLTSPSISTDGHNEV